MYPQTGLLALPSPEVELQKIWFFLLHAGCVWIGSLPSPSLSLHLHSLSFCAWAVVLLSLYTVSPVPPPTGLLWLGPDAMCWTSRADWSTGCIVATGTAGHTLCSTQQWLSTDQREPPCGSAHVIHHRSSQQHFSVWKSLLQNFLLWQGLSSHQPTQNTFQVSKIQWLGISVYKKYYESNTLHLLHTPS